MSTTHNLKKRFAVKSTLLPVAVALSAGVVLAVGNVASAAHHDKMEKCYGVAKAGHNDCATATSSCSGTSTKDGQKDAWLFLPQGTCKKLAGGSTKKPS